MKAEALKKENNPTSLSAVLIKVAKHFRFEEVQSELYTRSDIIFMQHYFLNAFSMLTRYERNLYGVTGHALARLLEAAYIEACCAIQKTKFIQSSLFKNQ
jgi:hypothetical protein